MFLDIVTGTKIPVGRTARNGFDWLESNATAFFDGVLWLFENLIAAVLWGLQSPHPFLVIAVIAGFSFWLRQSKKIAVLVVLGFLFIINQGYWEETTETLALVMTSCFLCMLVGVPVGILAAHRPRLYSVLRPVLDLMQSLPTFVYLIPAIVFFGIGMVPGLIATIIFVMPAPIRLTQLGISETPREMLEAADAFGASRLQKLATVEVPSALPQIIVGLTQTIMLSLSMVVIAALVGADGLGVPVVRALNQVNASLGFESGLVIVVLAILLDRIFRTEK